jgi:uncharacterized protein YwgA
MNKKDLVLAGLAASNDIDSYSPVQVQKLIFLIDKNAAQYIEGPHFNFQPYNYGPFDKGVYEVLEELERENLVEIFRDGNWREYKLTQSGKEIGRKVLEQMDSKVNKYFFGVSEFVRKHSFSEIVSAIYKAYPEMKENSVFQE